MDRIVIVTKPTRLEELIRKHLTEGAAKFALESRGQSMLPYKKEHAAYTWALDQVRREIPNDIPVTGVLREQLPTFLFREKDLVIVCGPDGLFANVAKYLGDQPVLTVNPDPSTVAGVLMLFEPTTVRAMLAKVQKGTHRIEPLPLVKATIDDRKVVWGVNDIFIGRKDHVSAQYELSFEGQAEHQSSSGIIVATGVGSTGWIRSVAAMVSGLTRDHVPHKLSVLPNAADTELVFVVREPFPSPKTDTKLITGRITPDTPLVVQSEMPDGGYIFSDGVTEKALEWNAGSKVAITVGERYVSRIVQ